MRTPTAKGFCSIRTPAVWSISKVSRALWPRASTACRAGSTYGPSGPVTSSPSRAPSRTRSPVTRWPNRTWAPRSSSCRRRFTRVTWSISVPTWGLASTRMLSGAPQDTNCSKIHRCRRSRVPVFSFPSEKAPAPPSPNCTLDSGSSTPVRQKDVTSRCRVTASCPRSSTMGRRPHRARTRAANRPPGPAPMTTGGVSGAARVSGSRYSSGVYGVTRRSRIRRSAAFSCRRVTAAV